MDYIIVNMKTKTALSFANGQVIVYSDKEEATRDLRENEELITVLPRRTVK